MIIASHVSLASAKNFLVSKLSQIQSIGHLVKTSNGYGNSTGFVAVDRNGAVKLVDRLEFGRANFSGQRLGDKMKSFKQYIFLQKLKEEILIQMRIIMLGDAGSGKSTYSKFLN